MASRPAPELAPWLQGLDTAWEEVPIPVVKQTSAVKADRSPLSRIPRRSQNVLHSSVASRETAAQPPVQRRRSPLAALSSSDNNTLRRQSNDNHSSGARSVSEASEGSVIRYSTLQQRAKGSSPVKQGTPEWKRRLLHGNVAYGDKTELFGPSGLDSIFTNPTSTENSIINKKANMSWAGRPKPETIPSSPPPWPSATRPPLQHGPSKGARISTGPDGSVLSDDNDFAEEPSSYVNSGEAPESSDMSDDFATEQSEGRRRVRPINRLPGEVTQDDIGANRTIGGQTELEQEDFSPVFVSKHTTVNGQIGYRALDSHIVKRFQNGTARAAPPHAGTKSVHPDGQRQDIEQSAFTDGPDDECSLPVPDLSLSENLPTGTPPVPTLGSNVELNRGGYSDNASFRERLLSPSQSVTHQSIIEPAPELLSPLSTSALQLPEAPSPPHLPSTPAHGNPHSQPKSRSSASPLKLFGPHDTFTNNRLLRRMSQLDPDLSNLSSGIQEEEPADSQLDTVDRQPSAASFGSGELNQHSFNADITITSASDPIDNGSDGSPGSEIAAPGSKVPVNFRFEVSPGPVDTFKLKRGLSQRGTASRSVSFQKRAPDASVPANTPPIRSAHSDVEDRQVLQGFGSGKRPPTTPGKDPTPKRRRTLHFSEVVSGDISLVGSQHKQPHGTSSSRKRKDARKGDDMIVAEPNILAQRTILKPRSSPPNPRQKEQIEAEIRETAEEFISQEPERLEAVMEQIESSMAADSPPSIKQQADMMANEVAKFSLRVQRASGDQTQRKRSVTTQDFFDEAVMVMKLIRERAGRQSVLGSVAESDQEALGRSQGSAVFDDDLSSLRVSRPPSREGGSGWRPRSAQTTDVRILSHLRKFQERDDTEFIAESMAVLDVQDDEGSAILAVDEEANIRISAPRSSGQFRKVGEAGSAPDSHRSAGSDFQTHATQHSAGTSTARTVPTSSTRKSDNVGMLGPDAVAHLISDHVGGMVFDKEKRQWVRSKAGSVRRAHGNFLEPLSTITSDDDPFREISDLPVDEAKEEEIRKASCTRNVSDAQQRDETTVESQVPSTDQPDSPSSISEANNFEPVMSDGHGFSADHPTSEPSNMTAPRDSTLNSSQQQQIETRATSWNDEEIRKLSQLSLARTSHLMMASALNQRRHPDSLATTRSVHQSSETTGEQRELPDNSILHHTGLNEAESQDSEESVYDESVVGHSDLHLGLRDDTNLYHDESDIPDLESPKLRHMQRISSYALPPAHRTMKREVSLRRKTLNSRLNTDAIEQSELSFVAAFPGERKMTLSLSVSRPVSSSPQSGQIIRPLSPPRLDHTFMLSDLPDFTISEEDPEQPSERLLAQRLAQYAVLEANDRFSLTVKDLVKTMTAVNEGELYWKELQQLNLQGRSLNSLYGLDDFCSQVKEIDLSCNAIAHLDGAPPTIRHLVARSCLLSSLTSWTHLMNLQYLDISGNKLDDLSGLGCLIHLRELRADENQITSIEGVQHLDGLLKLRVRRNRISAIDLGGSRLHRLEELDACDNEITAVEGLESLTDLKVLRFDTNPLQTAPQIGSIMPSIQLLSLRDCALHTLDVTTFPSLRALHVDGNHLATIHGIDSLKSIDLLSMRRQLLPPDSPAIILSSHLEARILRLSGTPLPSSLPEPPPLLSLQHLDLSSCGLSSLPEDFGLRLPNLRTLSLNFNHLKDLRPLLNISSLERLNVAGNLLSRLRKTVATLARFPALAELDVRENPLTIGFSAPLTASAGRESGSTVLVRRESGEKGEAVKKQEDEDDVREREEAGRYMLPERDEAAQKRHVTRMEEGIALRRRVYLMLLANGCAGLRRLDGGGWDRGEAMVRDATWERLVELGIVKKSGRAGRSEEEEV